MSPVPHHDRPSRGEKSPEGPSSRRASNERSVGRRAVLRTGVGLGVAVGVGWSVTGCTDEASADEDRARALLPHAQAAFRQQKAATALAPRVTEYTAAVTVVAEQRRAHLAALRDEIARLHSSLVDDITAAPADPAATPAQPAPDSVQKLRDQIERSADGAARTAVRLDGYRAGLLGSISASCRTLAKVQLT